MKPNRSLLLALAVVALLAAIWSFVLIQQPQQETVDQRVHEIGSQLKCPVCQGESVADSPATISQQMRGVIRQQVEQGKSDQQIIQYFEQRYGSQIIWDPQWQGFTILIWLVPIGLVLFGALIMFYVLRSWLAASSSDKDAGEEDTSMKAAIASEDVDEDELAAYRAQLERELAAEDPIFASHTRAKQQNRLEAL
jgi:cytochrome c-type biogenesis protein CcmH